MAEKKPPRIDTRLRKHIVTMPEEIWAASGIVIWGRRIKSLVFSTDIAIIRNCNADAVLAVYPFTPQQVITNSIITASSIPVFAGVGGGTTTGPRVVMLAKDAEALGAMAVVVNAPTTNEVIHEISKIVDIPVVITVYNDRSFSFITKTPPAAVLIKKACKLKSGSGVPNKKKVATITKAQLQEIAELKMPDLNAASVEAAMSMVAGTCRSMGVTVEE